MYMRLFSLFAALMSCPCLHGGSVNVINLVKRDSIQFTLSLAGQQASFDLPMGTSSGKFELEGPAKVSCREVVDSEIEIPVTEKPQIAIFHEANGKPEWKMIASVPSEGSVTLRVVNLDEERISAEIDGEEVLIESGEVYKVPENDVRKVMLLLPVSGIKSQFSPDEPRAGLAVIFKQNDKLKIVTVPDI